MGSSISNIDNCKKCGESFYNGGMYDHDYCEKCRPPKVEKPREIKRSSK